MNLKSKKILAGRVLNVGANKIRFNEDRLEEIKEAITKQDIKELVKSGAILIKEKQGRRRKEKRRKRRGKRVIIRKREYIFLVRKLRDYVSELKKQGKITKKKYDEIRIMIRSRIFRNKSHLQEYLGGKGGLR